MTLHIRARRVLLGANIYHGGTVVRLTLAGVPVADTMAGVGERARRHFPSLGAANKADFPGAVLPGPEGSGTDAAVLVARVALALMAPHQAAPGHAWCRREAHHDADVANVVLAAESVNGAHAAGRLAVDLVAGWLDGSDSAQAVRDARRAARAAMPTPAVSALLAAADRRGISTQLASHRADGVRIGSGASCALVFDTLTPLTPATAEVLTRDRLACLDVLADAGVSVVPMVRLRRVASEGPPPLPAILVSRFGALTPQRYIEDEAALEALLTETTEGLLLPAAETRCVFVVGDRAVATWPLRSGDPEAGAPDGGESPAPWCADSEASDAHALEPSTARMAVRAARALGLPTGAIHLCGDEDVPAVCAVDARPGLPWPSPAADAAADALLDALHPAGHRSDVRVVAVLESDPATPVAHRLAALLGAAGHVVDLIAVPSGTPPHAAHTALIQPHHAFLIVSCTPASVRDRGLGLSHCELVIVAVAGMTPMPEGLASPEVVVQRAARRVVAPAGLALEAPERASLVVPEDRGDSLARHRNTLSSVAVRKSDGTLVHYRNDGRRVELCPPGEGPDLPTSLAMVAADLVAGGASGNGPAEAHANDA